MIDTAAIASVANRSSTAPESCALFSIFIVASRNRSLTSYTRSAYVFDTAKVESVGKPRTESMK
ncbi:unknown [Eggerthella sp. CAG:298]|nr:unknown [Eggerthella sp. CAG:298]